MGGCYQRVISMTLIFLCALVSWLGVLSFLDLLSNRNKDMGLSEFFIAIYMIFFSVLLFLYEMMWWCTVDALNKTIRKNFGFMYKISGKALYLIFAALLCLGVDADLLGRMKWLQWLTGISWMAMGLFMLFLNFFKSEVFNNYQSPTGGLISDQDEGNNPV